MNCTGVKTFHHAKKVPGTSTTITAGITEVEVEERTALGARRRSFVIPIKR